MLAKDGEDVKHINDRYATWTRETHCVKQLVIALFVQLAPERAFRGNWKIWRISEDALHSAVRLTVPPAVAPSCEQRKEFLAAMPFCACSEAVGPGV